MPLHHLHLGSRARRRTLLVTTGLACALWSCGTSGSSDVTQPPPEAPYVDSTDWRPECQAGIDFLLDHDHPVFILQDDTPPGPPGSLYSGIVARFHQTNACVRRWLSERGQARSAPLFLNDRGWYVALAAPRACGTSRIAPCIDTSQLPSDWAGRSDTLTGFTYCRTAVTFDPYLFLEQVPKPVPSDFEPYLREATLDVLTHEFIHAMLREWNDAGRDENGVYDPADGPHDLGVWDSVANGGCHNLDD